MTRSSSLIGLRPRSPSASAAVESAAARARRKIDRIMWVCLRELALVLSGPDGYAPGVSADGDRLRHLEVLDVDHRDVVRGAIGGEDQLLVRRRRELPDPMPDEKVLLRLERLLVDDRDAVRGA